MFQNFPKEIKNFKLSLFILISIIFIFFPFIFLLSQDQPPEPRLPHLKILSITTPPDPGGIKEWLFRNPKNDDVIGIKVLQNQDHLSPLQWYRSQGFTGNPQAMQVDGYEAIRDGRTIYVAAPNIVGDKFYPNIYLISYSDGASSETINIYNQMLSNWKFNINIEELKNESLCRDNLNVSCLYDSDCPGGDYCLSQKARLLRDVKRIRYLRDVEGLLENYAEGHYQYPLLEAGTFIPGQTISVWPSWQGTLGNALGRALPLDPVNRIGKCEGYDPKTCWNAENKEFGGAIPENLPPRSFIFAYASKEGGYGYDLCSVFESNYIALYINSLEEGVCPGSFAEGASNWPPIILTSPEEVARITGPLGDIFEYRIRAFDPDGDTLTWEYKGPNWLYLTLAPGRETRFLTRTLDFEEGEPTAEVTITVTDTAGQNDTQTFNLRFYIEE